MKNKIIINENFALAPDAPSRYQKRWIESSHFDMSTTNQVTTGAAGKVHLKHFEVDFEVTVDAININNGDSVPGNVTVGIYGPLVTEETCAGAPLVVESASTALSGTNAPQIVSLTRTVLRPGRYYAAVEYSDTTARFFRTANINMVTGWTQYYDRGGGYGALTNPCPAVTDTFGAMPNVRVRCIP